MIVKLLLLFISCTSALIVPEELPSLLSVAYSNIPPIKKGTDSRVGFGFSLGNHADFQVLFELGPQTNTNPIGTPYASSSKRHANKPKKSTKPKTEDSDASKYLAGWSQNMKQKKTGKPFLPLPIPDEESHKETPHGTVNLLDLLANMNEDNMDGEVVLKQPSPANVPAETLTQLKQLYGEKQATSTTIKPMFVQKRPQVVKMPGNYERLSEFKIQEEQNNEAKKRQVTADLSDVSLDDE